MVLRYDAYKVERNDNLAAADFWNTRFKDIDLRLATRENDATRIDNAVDQLEIIALQRLADTFTPLILEAQARLNTLGASFSAQSLTSRTITDTGSMTFTLTEETATNYVYTDYVSIRSAASPENHMLAQVTSFARETRLLSVEIVSKEGSGTFADWLFRVGTPPEAGHAERTDNPHQVTAAQLGSPAGSAPAYTVSEADAAIAEAIAALPPISTALIKANNLSDLTDVAAARAALELSALAIASSVGYGDLATNIWATVANYRTKAANKVLQADVVFDAAAYVALTDASTINWDMESGFNFSVTLAASRTLAFPSHPKVGQTGYIDVTQPAGGVCSLGFASGFKFDNGVVPNLDTGANRVTTLFYHCRSTGSIYIGTAFWGVR